MSIKVLVFGQLTEIISKSEIDFPIPDNTEELTKELIKHYPKLADIKYAIAVNKKIVSQNTTLKENDSIALLPAFSGG